MPDIHTRLTKFNKDLLPKMVQLKYKAMSANIFSFYRGTCHLFFQDLGKIKTLPLSPLAWICGDMHLENFGSYKGDSRVVYFDLNDFDEGLLAPAAWDILRMITSILIALDELKIEEAVAMSLAELFLKNYAAILTKGKSHGIDPRTATGVVRDFLTTVEKRKQKELLKNRTVANKKGKLVFSADYPKNLPLSVVKDDPDGLFKKELLNHIKVWISSSKLAAHHFKVNDVTFRFAGTGSVGVKRYLFLLRSKKRYLLLDMKEARTSSVLPYTTVPQPQWDNDADRVIGVQQRMQNVIPALVSTTLFDGQSYSLQEMQPTEDKINFELMKRDDMEQVITDMALLTASAQLRSSGRQNSAIADDLIAYGKDESWHVPVLVYAQKYAKQVKKDYLEFMEGYDKGLYKV
jgi:uncharacterized protein (DUF2252 family)